MHQPLTPTPGLLPTTFDTILTRYLSDALTLPQIAAELRLSIPQVLEVIQSERAQRIIQALTEAEQQRHHLLHAIALTRALHTLTKLTDPDTLATDRSLELQRKAASTLLRAAQTRARAAQPIATSNRGRPSTTDCSASATSLPAIAHNSPVPTDRPHLPLATPEHTGPSSHSASLASQQQPPLPSTAPPPAGALCTDPLKPECSPVSPPHHPLAQEGPAPVRPSSSRTRPHHAACPHTPHFPRPPPPAQTPRKNPHNPCDRKCRFFPCSLLATRSS